MTGFVVSGILERTFFIYERGNYLNDLKNKLVFYFVGLINQRIALDCPTKDTYENFLKQAVESYKNIQEFQLESHQILYIRFLFKCSCSFRTRIILHIEELTYACTLYSDISNAWVQCGSAWVVENALNQGKIYFSFDAGYKYKSELEKQRYMREYQQLISRITPRLDNEIQRMWKLLRFFIRFTDGKQGEKNFMEKVYSMYPNMRFIFQ